MTTIIDKNLAGPAMHAFVIGVGYYHHLPGGSGEPMVNPLGLTQVTEPVLSSIALLDWLMKTYRHPKARLGSVEALISAAPSRRFRYNGIDVDRATLTNVTDAASKWRERCDRDPRNLALFYFCGHGLARDHQYLLLDDWGAQRHLPMATSIDLDKFHMAMAACIAATQIFIADACRCVPYELRDTYGDMGSSLMQTNLRGNLGRDAGILRSAAAGERAFGSPSQVTNYTKALLKALEGAGAAERPHNSDHWFVHYHALASAVNELLANPPDGQPLQQGRSGGEAGDALLAELQNPPQISVQVDCLPPEYADQATIRLSSAARNVSCSRDPCAGSWHIDLPADYTYQLSAELDDGLPPRIRTVSVLPPLCRHTITVVP